MARFRSSPRGLTLINVDALGQAVPSARFMGGREYETIVQGVECKVTPSDLERVLAAETNLLPAVVQESGPFQGLVAKWSGTEPPVGSADRQVAISLYLAMMTQTCLRLTNASGRTIVEGPFARNVIYLDMLAAATERPVFRSQSATGTSIGAALLARSNGDAPIDAAQHIPTHQTALKHYAQRWEAAAARHAGTR